MSVKVIDKNDEAYKNCEALVARLEPKIGKVANSTYFHEYRRGNQRIVKEISHKLRIAVDRDNHPWVVVTSYYEETRPFQKRKAGASRVADFMLDGEDHLCAIVDDYQNRSGWNSDYRKYVDDLLAPLGLTYKGENYFDGGSL